MRDLFVGLGWTQTFAVAFVVVFGMSLSAVCVARFLAQSSARRHALLLSTLLALLAVPVVGLWSRVFRSPLISIPVATASVADSDTANSFLNPEVRAVNFDNVPASVSGATDTENRNSDSAEVSQPAAVPQINSSPSASSVAWSRLGFAGLLMAAWIVGVIGFVAFTIRGYLFGRGIRRSATPIDAKVVAKPIQWATRHVGLPKPPTILQSDHIAGPAVHGVRCPVLLLPTGIVEQLSSQQLTDVLIHEFAHIHRRDTKCLLLEAVARCLYWPLVSVHWLLKELENAREEICDNYVVSFREDGAISYAETLLSLAEFGNSRLHSGKRIGAVGIMNWRGQLERRVASILSPQRDPSVRLRGWSFGLLIVSGLALCILLSGSRLVADDGSEKAKPAAFGPVSPQTSSLPTSDKEIAEAETRKITVHGKATDSDGKPVANATVYLVGAHWRDHIVAETKTDEVGSYEFKQAELSVKFDKVSVHAISEENGITWHGQMSLKDSATIASLPKEMAARAFDPTERAELNLEFAKPASLFGIIHDGVGAPIANAKVRIRQLDYMDPTGKAHHINYREFNGLHMLPAKYRESTTDANGKFQFSGLPFQSYVSLWVDHDDYATNSLYAAVTDKRMKEFERPAHSFSTIRNGQQVSFIKFETTPVSVNPVRVRLHATQKAVIHAIDENGNPLESMSVTANSVVNGTRISAYDKTNEKGIATLKLPPGKHQLSVGPRRKTDRVATNIEIQIVAGKDKKLDVPVKLGGILVLRAIDSDSGKPIAGISFSKTEGNRTSGLDSVPNFIDHPKTNEEGELRVLLPEGVHEIGAGFGVHPDGYRDDGKTRQVETKSGKETTATFRFEK